MAGQTPQNSVWSAMSYTPPRGRCNHKASLLMPGCPCLRFMLHPVKAATSFECDGCGHHASFHSLENPAEDAVIKKWAEQEASDREKQQAMGGASSKKRKMITQTAANDVQEVGEVPGGWGFASHRQTSAIEQTATTVDLPSSVARKPRQKGKVGATSGG